MNTHDPHHAHTPHQDDCDALRELLPAYALGLLNADDTARVETLLPRCADVAAELPEYAALHESLLLAVEPVAPPASARAAFLERLAAGEAPPAPAIVQAVAPVRSPAFWRVVSAAAIVILIATNVLWALQWNRTQRDVESLQARQTDLIAVMSGTGIALFPLSATADSTITLATAFWDTDNRRVTLYADQLEPLAPGQAYQLWLIDGESVVSPGIFQIDDAALNVAVFTVDAAPGTNTLIGISVEPDTGSSAPTTPPLAVGGRAAL
ncbi:MAG: anti-sigma factor [bacterium]|nr:anti-sigma factor [bacterium]